MNVTKLEYYQLAEIQVETAIDLFNQGNFVCAITLAGAGEELLGKLLPSCAENAVNTLAKAVSSIAPEQSHKQIIDSYLNIIRNGFKHLKEDICEQDIDIRLHAIQYIYRACTNYLILRNDLTPKMISFSDAHPSSSFFDVKTDSKA
jgi:hypothetical protein